MCCCYCWAESWGCWLRQIPRCQGRIVPVEEQIQAVEAIAHVWVAEHVVLIATASLQWDGNGSLCVGWAIDRRRAIRIQRQPQGVTAIATHRKRVVCRLSGRGGLGPGRVCRKLNSSRKC